MNAIADSVIIVGDLNVHHASWLRFSRGDTPRDRHLKDVCNSFGIRQLVSQPTREEYLLDLCLSSSSCSKVRITCKIADHACLLVQEPDAIETRLLEPREIWKLDDANWPEIEKYISDFDWGLLSEGTVDQALDVFMSVLDSQMHAYIPHFTKQVARSILPWLNDKCRQATQAKHLAEGCPSYNLIAKNTSGVLRLERNIYIAKQKAKMDNLKKNSKQWWSMNKRLLNRQAAPSLFPPLKDKNNKWCRTPVSKANAFAECWTAKCKLPPELFEHFFCHVADQVSGWFPIRARDVKKMLLKLRIDQATGPDGLSAKFLKQLAEVIALPLAIITRRIFAEGQWPERWRLHHIIPLFKKGSVYLPGQYRGVHLTCILSKTVERIIGHPLVKFLESKKYGDAQWTLRKMSSARDLVIIYVAR